jgi:phenylacetate-CoA ligase
MTVPATISDTELLRTRMAGAIGRRMPGAIERLGWSAGQLAAFQRDRLRALLARAVECSPFHAERLRGIDPARFELADLPRLPVLTKAQMMADFDRATTDRRLTLRLVEQHLARSAVEPSPLLGEYLCLVSGGSSGWRGLFVQTIGEYAEFAVSIMRRAMAAAMTSGGPPPDGLVFGVVGAGSPVHSSGLAAATATRPPIRLIPVPASLPTAEIVRRLNAAQPPALISYATKLAELAREQREGRLRLAVRSVISNSEALTAAARTAIGEALLTNLHNLTQPLIRYELTDRFTPAGASAGGYLRASVDGRSDDLFRYGEASVHPSVFAAVLLPVPAVREFQVRQTVRGADIAVVADGDFDPGAVTAAIAEGLRQAGVTSPHVSTRRVEALDRDAMTGKSRRFIPLGPEARTF